MAIQELLVKLTADNKDLKAKLSQSEKQAENFGRTVGKVGAVAVAAFAVAGAAVIAFGKQAYAAFEEQEKANKRLQFAVKGSKYAYKELTDQASKLQQKVGIEDNVIMDMQTLAASTGATTERIKKITEATLYLSKATGQDLNAAYLQVNGTLSGSAGRLGRLDAEFLTLTKDQLMNGDAIDLIAKKYKDIAEASVTDAELMRINWGDFMESFGHTIATVVNPALRAMSDALVDINSKQGFFQTLGTMINATIPGGGGMLGSSLDAMNAVSANKALGVEGTESWQKAKRQEEERAAKMAALAAKQAAKTPGEATAKSAKESNPFWDMPEQAKMSFDKLAKFIAESGAVEFQYNQDIENGTQEMLDNNLDAYSNFYSNLYEKKAAFAIASEEINRQLSDNELQAISDTFGMAASLFAEHTAAYKLFASAQAAMDTYKAANASYAALAGIPIIGPALGAVAAGVAIAAGLANVAKINGVAFANGGIVSGPTNALVGEYANARSNPEVIAPLDKLKSIMGSQVQRVEVYGYIDGDVIRLANKRSEHIAIRRG